MAKDSQLPWPPVESAYNDEFGAVDVAVHRAASHVWPQAEQFARATLGDAQAGQRLLMKAAANVTRVYAAEPQAIRHLPSYLLQSYKRLVLAEAQKETGRRERDAELYAQAQAGRQPEAAAADHRLLLREAMALMDEWTQRVFRWRVLGHSFAEIAVWLGTSENAARNKYNLNISRLAERFAADDRRE